MSEPLKPCPFCGAPPDRAMFSESARCADRSCIMSAYWTPVSQWNRRAPPAPDPRVEEEALHVKQLKEFISRREDDFAVLQSRLAESERKREEAERDSNEWFAKWEGLAEEAERGRSARSRADSLESMLAASETRVTELTASLAEVTALVALHQEAASERMGKVMDRLDDCRDGCGPCFDEIRSDLYDTQIAECATCEKTVIIGACLEAGHPMRHAAPASPAPSVSPSGKDGEERS